MDKLLETLNNFLKDAGEVIGAHAPQVWDATLRLIFWNGLISLIGNIVLLALLFTMWVWPWRKWFNYNREQGWEVEGGGFFAFLMVTAALLVATPIIFFSMSWLYYLVCVIDPQLGVIYALATKAGII